MENNISTHHSTSQPYKRPVEILQKLIRFNTTNPPGNEAECIAYIRGLLSDAGIESVILAKKPDRPNLIARIKGERKANPLLLYGHVDVVTTEGQKWDHPPFEGKIVDGFVWGRGALDMKSGIAMMLAAFLRAKAEGLKPAGDVLLTIVCDEEPGGDFGAKFLVENHAELFGIFVRHWRIWRVYCADREKRFYPITFRKNKSAGSKQRSRKRRTRFCACARRSDDAIIKTTEAIGQKRFARTHHATVKNHG